MSSVFLGHDAMFTIDELKTIEKKDTSRILLRMLAFIVPGFMVSCLLAILLLRYLDDFISWTIQHDDEQLKIAAMTTAIVWIPVVCVVLTYWVITRMGMLRIDPPLLHCPHCRESWDGLSLIVESGNCYCCGRKVIVDSAPSEIAPRGIQLMTLEAFIEKARIAQTMLRKSTPWFTGSIFVLWIVGMLGLLPLSMIYPTLKVYLIVLPLVVLGYAIAEITFLENKHKRVARDLGLLCPSCNKSLFRQTGRAIAMRRCPFCKTRILAEPV